MSYNKTTQFLDEDVCGFEWAFRKHCREMYPNETDENSIALPADVSASIRGYNTAIEAKMAEYKSNPALITQKTLPVIFHLITESSATGSVSSFTHATESNEMTFNIKYVLDWVNHWFSGTSISFGAADLNENAEPLTNPGLNIIEGSTVTQTRFMGPELGNVEQFYNTDGVALDEFSRYGTTETDKVYQPGVLFNYIQDVYSWDPTKYINIFLLNRTNSSPGKVAMISTNPYVAELSGNLKNLSIGVDLWAIGRSYDSSIPQTFDVGNDIQYTNFGYSYTGTTSAAVLTNISEGYRARAKTIAHSLAHTLGLANVRHKFLTRVSSLDNCDSPINLFNADRFNTHFGDNDIGTDAVGEFWKMLNYDEALAIDSCGSEETILSISNNMMNHNQFTGGLNSEDGVVPTFTQNQIRRMHANCEYTTSVFNEESNEIEFTYGILGNILYNSSTVFQTSNDSVDNDGCLETRTSVSNNTNIPSSLQVNSKDKVSENEIEVFRKSKNIVKGIINKLN